MKPFTPAEERRRHLLRVAVGTATFGIPFAAKAEVQDGNSAFNANDLTTRLNWALDDGDFELACSLFTKDGRWAEQDSAFVGRAEILRYLKSTAARFAGLSSNCQNVLAISQQPGEWIIRSYRFVYSSANLHTERSTPRLVAHYKIDDIAVQTTEGFRFKSRTILTIAELPEPWQ